MPTAPSATRSPTSGGKPPMPSQHSIDHPSKMAAMLSGAPASPDAPSGLTGMLASPNFQPSPQSTPPAAVLAAPAQAVPVQGAPPGRQMTAAVTQQIQSLTPQQRAIAEQRADYLVHVYGSLSRKPDLTRDDVVSMGVQSIATGKATPDEVSAELAGLPRDPKQLRAELQRRFKAQILAASLLSGSNRQASPQPGSA